MSMQKERTPRIHGWMTLHMGAQQGTLLDYTAFDK